jgi:hypothetical protein
MGYKCICCCRGWWWEKGLTRKGGLDIPSVHPAVDVYKIDVSGAGNGSICSFIQTPTTARETYNRTILLIQPKKEKGTRRMSIIRSFFSS